MKCVCSIFYNSFVGGQVYPTAPGSYEYSQAYLIISNINCSCDSPPCSINNCSYDVANDGYCRSHAGDVIVRCHNSMSTSIFSTLIILSNFRS